MGFQGDAGAVDENGLIFSTTELKTKLLVDQLYM
jgi:hypothetical protein